jgi:thiol-disulfide isomerase/thioredoxin
MSRSCMLLIPGFVGGLLLLGCGQDAPKANKEDPGKQTTNPKPSTSTATVELKPATLKEVNSAIAGQKGKIVVVDVWGEFCRPCKEEFHNLVRLHHTYGKDGVTCMSLCLPVEEDEKKPQEKTKALAFLKTKEAVLTNFWLEGKAPYKEAQDQWHFEGIPVAVVYDRDGQVAKIFTRDDPDDQFTYEDVEKLVKKMIQK